MAYRRRQGITKSSTFKEEIYHPPEDDNSNSKLKTSQTFTGTSSLAAQAMRASAAHRDSSLSSANAGDSLPQSSSNKVFDAYDGTSRNDTKGFWGVVARKAKEIFEDENFSQQFDAPARSRFQMQEPSSGAQSQQSYLSTESFKKMDNPTLRKGFDKLASKLNHIGDTFEKAFEEGRTIVETKTADIKLHIRRKGNGREAQNQVIGSNSSWQQPMMQPALSHDQMNHETQLKASRDVAMATAAKAKLLLRELKTVKADLAFAKQRCSQLEEENKMLREGREKGSNPADDDLIRLQLETLLAEKARLAHENSIYARENRFLREIVEYHQLTMQDVVYVDEGMEEVTEVYPITRMLSGSPPSPSSPPSTSDVNTSAAAPVMEEFFPVTSLPEEIEEGPDSVAESGILTIREEDGEKDGISNAVSRQEVAAEKQDNTSAPSVPSHDF